MTIVTLLVLIVVAVIGARLYLDRAAETAIFPGEDVAIGALRGKLAQNAFLACPPDYCGVVSPLTSPVFPVGVERLYDAWLQAIGSEPRVTIVTADPQRRRVVAMQRSALFRFPDIIVAEFVPLGPQGGSPRSGIAVYSRSRYGQGDFGVNRHRVEAWLGRLKQIVPPDGPSAEIK